MKRSLAIALCALSACGGLENEPFKTGTIRGQLVAADANAVVAVVGQPALVTHPDSAGRFTLEAVPLGTVDLLIVVNAALSHRQPVVVGGASVVELGALEGRRSGKLELYVQSVGRHVLTGGTVSLVGLPLTSPIVAPENEAEFTVPAGCYEARVVVPGLPETTVSGCVGEAGLFEQHLDLEPPDGTPGSEGCSITGCEDGLVCQADFSCR